MKNRTNNLGKSTKKMVRVAQAEYNSDFMGNEGININGWRNMLNTGSFKKLIHKDAVISFVDGETNINLLTILDRSTLSIFNKKLKKNWGTKKDFSTFVKQLDKIHQHHTQKDRIKYAQQVLIRIVSQITTLEGKTLNKPTLFDDYISIEFKTEKPDRDSVVVGPYKYTPYNNVITEVVITNYKKNSIATKKVLV